MTATDENVSRIFPNLAPGTYTVSEMVPEDRELTGITCTPATAAAIAGTRVTITLAPGGSVVCTYNDTRIDPPVPPEPPEPQPPEPPVSPERRAAGAAGCLRRPPSSEWSR